MAIKNNRGDRQEVPDGRKILSMDRKQFSNFEESFKQRNMEVSNMADLSKKMSNYSFSVSRPDDRLWKADEKKPGTDSSNIHENATPVEGLNRPVTMQRKHVLCSREKPRSAAVSALITTDFVVSSASEENLLLTISVQRQKTISKDEALSKDGFSTSSRVSTGIFTPSTPFSQFALSHHAARVATEPNAGGASVVSEALSVEYFVRRFKVTNVVTEMEVEYLDRNMKKVDYICDIYGQRVGVSVTRAMSYPDPGMFSKEKAVALLRKKLQGLMVARSGVSKRHSFVKAILHVWCETIKAARLMQAEFDEIAKENQVEDDVIMILTVAEGTKAKAIFYESRYTDSAIKAKRGKEAQVYPLLWVKAF